MQVIKYKGQLFKRVDRMHDGNPENARELEADLGKCKKAEILVKKLEADLDALEYDLGSLAIASRGHTETKKGLETIKKELKERESELHKMKF